MNIPEKYIKELFEPLEKYIPHIITLAILAFALYLPVKITSYGFTPPDDARRHVAKVLSGKNWNQILVLGKENKLDPHKGWHYILEKINGTFSPTPRGLVVFSVASLFGIFILLPAIFFKRKEAWLISLAIFSIFYPGIFMRIMLGRPFIFTMAAFIVTWLIFVKFKQKSTHPKWYIFYTILITIDAWIHPSWYLYIFPIGVIILTREFKAAIKIGICIVIATITASLISGSPVEYFSEGIFAMTEIPDQHLSSHFLVGELIPTQPPMQIIFIALAFLAVRFAKEKSVTKTINTPVFIMLICGTILGLKIGRFLYDWAIPAAITWFALETQRHLKDHLPKYSWHRLTVSTIALIVCFISISSDIGRRWTQSLKQEAPSYNQATEDEKLWFPGDGGIVYSNYMNVYYGMFYSNPTAEWKYILGHEPKLMPKEDLQIIRKIQWNGFTPSLYRPWIEKMKPEDRLVIYGSSTTPQQLTELEWKKLSIGHWFGKLPEKKIKQHSSITEQTTNELN